MRSDNVSIFPLFVDTVEIHRSQSIIFLLSIRHIERNHRGVMLIQIHDCVVLGVEQFHIFIVFDKYYIIAEKFTEGEEVILVAKIFDSGNLLGIQTVALELFNAFFLVLHP